MNTNNVILEVLLKNTGNIDNNIREIGHMAEDNESYRIKGVVGEVGLQRNGDQFNAFNLTINLIVNPKQQLTYDEGEKLMQQFRKDLLGKNVEIAQIIILCPICEKGFNTEAGMKQHMRIIHDKKKKKKPAKKTVRNTTAKPKKSAEKTGKKKRKT